MTCHICVHATKHFMNTSTSVSLLLHVMTLPFKRVYKYIHWLYKHTHVSSVALILHHRNVLYDFVNTTTTAAHPQTMYSMVCTSFFLFFILLPRRENAYERRQQYIYKNQSKNQALANLHKITTTFIVLIYELVTFIGTQFWCMYVHFFGKHKNWLDFQCEFKWVSCKIWSERFPFSQHLSVKISLNDRAPSCFA